MMGFTETAKHRSKEVFLFQQNDINIVLNGSPTGHVHEFALKHGPSACAMAFRVKNASRPPPTPNPRAPSWWAATPTSAS